MEAVETRVGPNPRPRCFHVRTKLLTRQSGELRNLIEDASHPLLYLYLTRGRSRSPPSTEFGEATQEAVCCDLPR